MEQQLQSITITMMTMKTINSNNNSNSTNNNTVNHLIVINIIYNASLAALKEFVDGLPKELTFDDAKDPESSLYLSYCNKCPGETVPFAVKRSAIDMQNFLDRCKEEQQLLLKEVNMLFDHYLERKECLEESYEVHSQDDSKLSSGICTVVKNLLCETNNVLLSLGTILRDYLQPRLVDILSGIHATASAHVSTYVMEDIEEDNEMAKLEEEIEDLVALLADDDDDDHDHDGEELLLT
jgi:hypothetical protein